MSIPNEMTDDALIALSIIEIAHRSGGALTSDSDRQDIMTLMKSSENPASMICCMAIYAHILLNMLSNTDTNGEDIITFFREAVLSDD